jgi:hypothetical protein
MFVVLEHLGLVFESDEEYNEFFFPIDTDEVMGHSCIEFIRTAL